MQTKRIPAIVTTVAALILLLADNYVLDGRRARVAPQNPSPPASPVKLVFIHHSVGDDWLGSDMGDLGSQLGANNYYVSDTYYDWGPDDIGSYTDVGQWWDWFRGPSSSTYTQAVYDTTNRHADYTRPIANPGGENQIVMFKSCYPNSHLGGSPGEPPTTGPNPLRGEDYTSEHHTVGNAKGIYNDLLAYFATRQDKLFIVITAPPLVANETDAAHALNARAFNTWLVYDWLDDYPYENVAVFDFYNVLTSNGGDRYTSDLGWETGNHHRWWNSAEQYIQTVDNDFAAYGSDPSDSHPTAAGMQKAAAEFVPLLNTFTNRWMGSEVTPTPTATGTPPTATSTPTPTATPRPACQELLTNGNFETGSLSPWGSSGDISLGWGHSSAYGARLGGTNNAHGELLQEVSIPSGASSVDLTFWWLTESASEQPGDAVGVYLQYGEQADLLQTLRAEEPLGEWQWEALDLGAYVGQTVIATFLVHTDGEIPSTFRVDDVSLGACGVGPPMMRVYLPIILKSYAEFVTPTPCPSPSPTLTPTGSPSPTPTSTPTGDGCPAYPPDFTFITDREVYSAPSLVEPAPRQWFSDPTFGPCLVRVTDRGNDLSPGDESPGMVNEYARVQSFNADGSRLLAHGTDGTWYLYDARTLQPLGELPLVVEPRWDAGDPNLIYYSDVDEKRLMSYDVQTAVHTEIHDFDDDFPGQNLAAVWTCYEGSPSRDRRTWGLMAEDWDWVPVAFLVYDLQADQVTIRDMRDVPAVQDDVDHVSTSPLGTYFLASFDRDCPHGELGDDAHPCGLMVYEWDLTNGRSLLRTIGHYDPALDAQGREVVIYQDNDTDYISMLDLASGAVTPLWEIDFSHTAIGLHFSGLAFDRPGWAVVSTHDDDAASHTWMDDGVFLVELKAGGRVVRLAHTHSIVDESQPEEYYYWAEPHASTNPDLTRLLFTTNWGRYNTGEVEMVMIALPPDWPERLGP